MQIVLVTKVECVSTTIMIQLIWLEYVEYNYANIYPQIRLVQWQKETKGISERLLENII